VKSTSAENSGHYSFTDLASQPRLARLANAGAQETSVILHAYLAAGQKIRHCCNRFGAAARAGTNCQDQITERKPSARFHDLAKLTISFHMLAISGLSRSSASVHCEYVFHGCACVIHFLCTLELTVERHFCSILKHESDANASTSGGCQSSILNCDGCPSRGSPCRVLALARLQSLRFLPVRLTTNR
jgi:hypothetical protein